MKPFISRLKKRQVFRVAGIYAVSAWPLIQIADLAVPALGLPDSVMTLLLTIFVAGFPLSLVFAWLFNFTDRGIVRATAQTDEANEPKANKQTLFAVSGTLTIVLLVTLGSQLLMEQPEEQQAQVTNQTTPTPPNVLPQVVSDGKASIAILPFVPFSADPQDEFFADGMVEELLNLLAKIPELRVAARTSSFAYKGVTDKSIPQIGQELGVGTILEGSIRKNDVTNKVRVTAQLIKVSSGEHLWSHTYDREYRDIFQIQDEIARSVVKQMKVTLLGANEKEMFAPQTTSIDAMVAFGKGKKEMGHRTAESLNAALAHFQQATQLDPHYARAFAAIADVYNLLRIYGHLDVKLAKQNAATAVEKALSLDDKLAEAYAAKGLLYRESDEALAEVSLKRAIELNPNYAPAYMWYGTLLKQKGDQQGAHELKKKAFELDPKSPISAYLLAVSHYQLGQENQAMALFSHIIANDPYYPGAYNLVGDILFRSGRLDEAVQMYQRALDVDQYNADAVKGLLVSYADLGNVEQSDQWFDYADKHNGLFNPSQYNMLKFRSLLARGERTEAIDLLQSINLTQDMGPQFDILLGATKAYFTGDYHTAVADFERLRQQPGTTDNWFYQADGGRAAVHLAHAYQQLEMSDQFNVLVAAFEQYLLSIKDTKINDPNYYYMMALLRAMQNKVTEAFHYLQGAIDVGWVQVWQAENEPVFARFSSDVQFTLMIGSVKARLAAMRQRMIDDKAFVMNEEI